MRPVLLATTILLFLAHGAAAFAGDSMQLAENGGFLLGNAHRCGAASARVVRAGRVIRDLIDAAAPDRSADRSARLRFAEMFIAAAYPQRQDAMPQPSCALVLRQFGRLERFHREAGFN